MSPETRQPKEAEIEQLTHELASLETKRRTLQAEIETVSGEMEKISVRLEQLRQGSDIGQAVEEADTKKETASKHELFPGFEWENKEGGVQIRKFEPNGHVLMRIWRRSSDMSGYILVSIEVLPNTLKYEIPETYEQIIRQSFTDRSSPKAYAHLVVDCTKPAEFFIDAKFCDAMRKSHDPLEEFYSFHPTLRVGGQWRTEVEKVVNKAKKSEDKGNPRLMSGFQWEDQKNSTQIKETGNGGELLMRVWPVSDPSGDSFVSFEIKPGSHIGLYSRYVNDLFKESPDSRKESRIVQSCKKPALLRFPKDYDDALEEISKKSNPLEIGVDRFIVERGELLM